MLAAAIIWGLAAEAAASAAPSEPVAEPVGIDDPAWPALDEDVRSTLGLFWEAWRIVHEEFLDRSALDPHRLIQGAIRGLVRSLDEPVGSRGPDELPGRLAPDPRRLTHAAIRGLVQSLGDPDSRFQTPEESRAEAPGYSGRLEGIGTCVELRGGRVTTSAPIEGSPAARAGLRSGDVILAVDGRAVEGRPIQDTALRIRGPAGTGVTLTVRRAEGAAPLELSIERAAIELRSAQGRMLEPGIGLLRVIAFTETTDAEAGRVLDDLGRAGARALVLDLRGNSGGLVTPAIELASRFVPAGPIAWKEDGRGHRSPYDRADRPLVGGPLVLLVDRGTASAAEIVAAALRDAGGARLVGQRTYGKGAVQHVHRLSDGSTLFVTAARWVSPAGARLDQGGLAPDIPADAARSDSAELALERALQVLRQSVGRNASGGGSSTGPPAAECTLNSAGAA